MARHRRTPLRLHRGSFGPHLIVSRMVGSNHALVFFDPYHLRPATYHLVALHRPQRAMYRVLAGCIGNQNDRHRQSFPRRTVRVNAVGMALHDRFNGNFLLGEPGSDRRGGSGQIARNRATGRPNGLARIPRATSAMSATTADAVAAPPAPGPTSVIGGIPAPSMVTALVTPITCAIEDDFGTMVGCTRCSIPFAVRTATPSSLTR